MEIQRPIVLLAVCATMLAAGASVRAQGAAATGAGPRAGAAGSALKIVVLAGEDAVNVIQQKSAVAPLVEVRDRNDAPVAGAIVRFAIRGGRATFGGRLRVLSVTTDATGRAAAGGLLPTSSGAVQITATASFQGQTALATISQVNVATAAQAAAAAGGTTASGAAGSSSTAAGGGVSGGAAGGAGTATAAAGAGAASTAGAAGGISTTTIAAIGGAAAGGTIVATKALGEDVARAPAETTYAGDFSGPLVITFTNANPALPPNPCTVTLAKSGTLALHLNGPSTEGISGTTGGTATWAQVATTCSGSGFTNQNDSFNGAAVTGTPGAISASGVFSSGSFTEAGGGTASYSDRWSFSGALSGDVVTGAITLTWNTTSVTRNGVGTVVIPITLR